MYQVIVMSFDGSIQRERPQFETIQDAWDYAGDLGSKWYFYPFTFVIKNQTIKDAPDNLDWAINKRIKTIRNIFLKHNLKEETQNMGVEEFTLGL